MKRKSRNIIYTSWKIAFATILFPSAGHAVLMLCRHPMQSTQTNQNITQNQKKTKQSITIVIK